MNDINIMTTDKDGNLADYINPILDLKSLSRNQVKNLAKEIANGESITHSWREVANDDVTYDSKNDRQKRRFKRIFNKQLNQNLIPILEKQRKQELIDRMKSGDTSAMEQWTTEGIDKFGHQFMPVMLTAATLPFGIGAFGQTVNVNGLLPTLGSEVGSWGLGYGGYKLGEKLDDSFGTNFIAPITSIVGGVAGYHGGLTAGMKAADAHTINQAFKSGQLKYGEPTAYTAYHQSSTPITKFKFPFKRWDVKMHGADPNGAFFTIGDPAKSGFLAERPYTGQFYIRTQKPLIQTGEITGTTKNNIRNAIVRRARRDGADAILFDGIADNQLQNQKILFATDKANIDYRGMVDTPFKRQLFWDSPKGMRDWDAQMGVARNSGNQILMERLREKHFSLSAKDNMLTWKNSTSKWIADSPKDQLKIVSVPKWTDPLNVPADTPVTFWHGSGETFNIFDYGKASGTEPHFYFSTSKLYPQDFMLKYRNNSTPVLRRFYLYSKNPKRILNGFDPTKKFEPDWVSWPNVEQNIRLQPGADSFYGPDYAKGKMFFRGEYPYISDLPTEIAIPDNKKIKLADPLVFDDRGYFIKLSKRDDFTNPDIRYEEGGKINP